MAVQPKLPPKMGGSYAGQIAEQDKFAVPMQPMPIGVPDMGNTINDIGEKSGFIGDTSDYIDKKGTPYGEAAKFNFLPPGMDIGNQKMVDIREMALKEVTSISYPGDGWQE